MAPTPINTNLAPMKRCQTSSSPFASAGCYVLGGSAAGDGPEAAIGGGDGSLSPRTLKRSQSAPQMERILREQLSREREMRSVAERESALLSVFSPLERFLLLSYASAARVARAPKPRCLCCGGPLFWCLIVPWAAFRYLAGVSPLVLLAPKGVALEERDAWWAEARRPAVDYLRRRGPPARLTPVVMLPGMTSTALEVWRGVGCYAGSHRRRLWSSASMLATFLREPDCLQRHLAMNLSTWEDPTQIRVRASTGLGAADAFGPLNLWGELMANFAVLGYDESSLRLLGFDWRLSPERLERRDRFFTTLRREVELLVELNGAKVAILAHSLGANHAIHFFQWIEAREPGWVADHVRDFVPIGGAYLGSAKALAYLVSGTMTDAVGMGPLLNNLFESHGGIKRRAVADLTRSWSSVPALLPKGGDAYWGLDATLATTPFVTLEAPPPEAVAALARDAARGGGVARALLASANGTTTFAVDGSMAWLKRLLPAYYALLDAEYSLAGPPAAGEETSRNERDYGNPLLAPLPRAPAMRTYCLYGVGRPTPVAFTFGWAAPRRSAPSPAEDVPERYLVLSTSDASSVVEGDGDGTVPLLSLGYMCASGYGVAVRNPSRSRVRLKEYKHEALSMRKAVLDPVNALCGLANEKDSDHITILGNREMIYDILDIVAYDGAAFEERVESDVCDLAARLRAAHPDAEAVLDDGTLTACAAKARDDAASAAKAALAEACRNEPTRPECAALEDARREESTIHRVLDGRKKRRADL